MFDFIGVCFLFLLFGFFFGAPTLYQNALKGEEEPQASTKMEPGKKRKNSKKNQSRKRTNAQPEKGVCVRHLASWLRLI